MDTGISYSGMYSEWDACLGCGLDLWMWESNVYPKWFKVYVIAFHNMRTLISLHTEEAVSKESEKNVAKARAKRGR